MATAEGLQEAREEGRGPGHAGGSLGRGRASSAAGWKELAWQRTKAGPSRGMVVLLPLQLVLPSQGTFPTGSLGLLEVGGRTGAAPCPPSCFKGLFVASQHHSPASISPNPHVSKLPPPEPPGTCLPHYAASPNDLIPLSQLAEASSGDSGLQSPARTQVCQVNLAPKTPKQSCRRLRGERALESAGSRRRGRCWVGDKGPAGKELVFSCVLSPIQVPSPLQTKGLQSELSTEIQAQG